MCLLSFGVIIASGPDGRKPNDGNPEDSRVYLVHSDVLYKNSQDPRAEVLVGNVQLKHNGATLFCDSAKFYRDNNSFDAFGHVKMLQGDTLSLTSDTLFYDGPSMFVRARGRECVLIHRKTRLVSSKLDYDRANGIGNYYETGTIYDQGSKLVSTNGEYRTSNHTAYFTENVRLDTSDGDVIYSDNGEYSTKTHDSYFSNNVRLYTHGADTLLTNDLYYNTDTDFARITSQANIRTKDGTFVNTDLGDYNTRTGKAHLYSRSRIYKDMRDVEGDSLFFDKTTGMSEAFGNAIVNDWENQCTLKGNYVNYNENTGDAVATDSALVIEFSTEDTLYIHGDTLKMFTFNINTDSVYRNLHAYHKVRLFRNDVQAVCDSMVTLERDSCTYLYGQPILWNEQQQVFGEEIRVYNNDSTIDWIHIINQAMTIERIDSVSYNQVAGKEMKCYFVNGEIDHNEAHGNVYVVYFMDEDDGSRIGMNYTETTDLTIFMEEKKVTKIWMPAATGTMYPVLLIPEEKRYLQNFAWFDYIRPVDKDDVFEWRAKDAKNVLKKTESRNVPLQKLSDRKKKPQPKL